MFLLLTMISITQAIHLGPHSSKRADEQEYDESLQAQSECYQYESLMGEEYYYTPCPPILQSAAGDENHQQSSFHSCITLDQFCDGWPHCPGGTDEDPTHCSWQMPVQYELGQIKTLISLVQKQFLDFFLRITLPMSPHTSMGGRVQHQPRPHGLLEGFLDHNQQPRRNLEEKLRSDLADRASQKLNYQD